MMRRFRASKLISLSICDYLLHHQSLSATRYHVDSPLMLRFLSSSTYNNGSNDGYGRGNGKPPSPPRRRPGGGTTASDRSPSSSRLSGFIDGDHDRGAAENRGRGYGGGRRDFDTNRIPNNYNENRSRPSNRVSQEVNNTARRNSDVNRSYVPFSDDEQKPQMSANQQVNDTKLQDDDGFLERFKLEFDQPKNKPTSRGGGEGEVESEQQPEAVAPPSGPEPPPEEADEIFRRMKETGLIPNAVAMLHGLCSDGLVQDAMKLFGVMRERGTIPEVVIYTAVVEGFCKAQKLDDAKRIFRKMQSNGVVANAFSYGVLVQGLCKGKKLDDALEFCLEMVEAGHSPNLVTFVGLVDGFCRERSLEAAIIMISNLREKGYFFEEKAVREFLDKKGPFSPLIWEAIFGKKSSERF